jgi:acyl-CoA synthetase (AMP-forming)/AMP-acid ligase II
MSLVVQKHGKHTPPSFQYVLLHMNLAEWLVRTARRTPVAPALFNGGELVSTYREFAHRAAAVAAFLEHEMGVKSGDRVALYMSNRTEYLDLMYGIWFAGAVVVPINAKLHWREAVVIVQDCSPSAIFLNHDADAAWQRELASLGCTPVCVDDPQLFADAQKPLRDAPVDRAETDLAWLFYTSGTTGKPKGVMLSHGNLMAMSLTYLADVDDVHAADAALYAAPMSHGAGLYNFVHVLRGARHIVPVSGGFAPTEVLELAMRCGPISMFAAPTMVRRLTAAARSCGSEGEGIRTVVYGGGPMYVKDIQEALQIFGPRFVQIYGQGETPMCITALDRSTLSDSAHPRWEQRIASVGLPQSCVQVRVVDEAGRSCEPGGIGEIVVKGSTVMSGYWQAPEASARTLLDGWLWTGDVGLLDGDGYLTLKDRSKDVIITGGSNVYPREVEECLLLHPAVEEVAVVGEHDPEWGESVIAFVVARPGKALSASDLDRLCQDRIARFKRPKTYVFTKELPKNNYGKVLKTELRSRLAAAAPADKEGVQ